MKNVLLFLIVCVLAGMCVFIGSVLAHSLGKVGLFSGAIIGGIVGVAVAIWVTTCFSLLDSEDHNALQRTTVAVAKCDGSAARNHEKRVGERATAPGAT